MYVIVGKNGKYLKGLITHGYMNSWTFNIDEAIQEKEIWGAKKLAKRVKGKYILI